MSVMIGVLIFLLSVCILTTLFGDGKYTRDKWISVSFCCSLVACLLYYNQHSVYIGAAITGLLLGGVLHVLERIWLRRDNEQD